MRIRHNISSTVAQSAEMASVGRAIELLNDDHRDWGDPRQIRTNWWYLIASDGAVLELQTLNMAAPTIHMEVRCGGAFGITRQVSGRDFAECVAAALSALDPDDAPRAAPPSPMLKSLRTAWSRATTQWRDFWKTRGTRRPSP